MSNERESLLPAPKNDDIKLPAVALHSVDYDIDGNVFRAYYDAAQNMVFVVDSTKSVRKPNVLLVLPHDGERKWDEILTTDWGVDLETIRPRQDNKYQKLDVEYGNVDAYSRVVRDFQVGTDARDALDALNVFRDNAVRRNALARLDAARDASARAGDTIDKTNDSIAELNVRLKELRTKLSVQKKSIGKEPTKQSAAKILRTDSQIESTIEKIERARRRLANARRRMGVAEDDISAAQGILDLLGTDVGTRDTSHSVMVAPHMDMIATNPTASESEYIPQFKEIITEPKAEEMAEEEVKPLFDKDPEILDEEIAFKPIDFGVSTITQPVADVDAGINVDASPAPAPLSFTPPRGSEYDAPSVATGDFAPIPDVPDVPSVPVLDSMRTVEPIAPQPVAPSYDTYQNPGADERAFAAAAANAPIVQQPSYDNVSGTNSAPVSGGTEYNNAYTAPVQNAPRPVSPVPGVADAGVSSGFRPVSPISGASVGAMPPVQRKSKIVYYMMLVMLIALSIFTLWIYQRSTSQNIPELTTTVPVENPDTDGAKVDVPSPFIDVPAKTDVEPEIVPEPVAEPEPVVPDVVEPEAVIAEPEPVLVEPEPVTVVPEPVAVEPEPVDTDADVTVTTVEVESPFLTDAVEKPKIEINPINIEPIVNKPAYNVSQQDKMFVASPEYETDAPVVNDTVSGTYSNDDMETCSDGALPDANGCCGGEVFTDMENGTFACCQPVEGGECFAPLR